MLKARLLPRSMNFEGSTAQAVDACIYMHRSVDEKDTVFQISYWIATENGRQGIDGRSWWGQEVAVDVSTDLKRECGEDDW